MKISQIITSLALYFSVSSWFCSFHHQQQTNTHTHSLLSNRKSALLACFSQALGFLLFLCQSWLFHLLFIIGVIFCRVSIRVTDVIFVRCDKSHMSMSFTFLIVSWKLEFLLVRAAFRLCWCFVAASTPCADSLAFIFWTRGAIVHCAFSSEELHTVTSGC